MSKVDEILERAMQLPHEERERIVIELLSTLALPDSRTDEEWRAELVRRLAEIDNGTVELVGADVVMARLREGATADRGHE